MTSESPLAMTRKAALLAMLFSTPVLLIFICLGKIDEGIGAWICAGLIVHSTRVRWNLRRNAWFWVASTTAVLLQVPFVVFVPWGDRYMSSISFLPFGILDFAIIWGCFNLAEKVMRQRERVECPKIEPE
jgi:ABC-type amino acid transport system permease subunit